jgi:trehalose 6-phosphate phosphatase
VIELRLPGYDKATALRQLLARASFGAALFAGDDLGDLPAFAEIRRLRAGGQPAWSVAATSTEAPEVKDAADILVDGPDAVVVLLRRLAVAPAP